MLDVEEHFMIKDLYRKGVSISEIARRTGHDRKTVRKLATTPLAARPSRSVSAQRAHKLDPFLPYLQARLGEGVFNAAKLLLEIKAQGYQGGKTQLKDWLQPQRPPRPVAATVRFETEPGEQAQTDWAHFGTIIHQGQPKKLYAFLMTLGFSRVMFLTFMISTDITAFLRGHLQAFHYFGGVPRKMLHDNLKTAVLERRSDGTIHFHPRYLDFADYYGFAPHACRPYRAQTKGKVERGVEYVRGNFWVGLHFRDLDDLNCQARSWLDTVANTRVHGTTGVVPFSRLAEEGLVPLLAKPDYDTSALLTRQSSRDCLISYAGNFYSLPAAYAQQQVVIKVTPTDELRILTIQGQEIACHALSRGHNERITCPEHYAPLRSRSTTLPQVTPQDAPPQLLLGAPAVEVRALAEYDAVLEVV